MLVVGSAPCLFDDVKRALTLRPFASMMLVNGACTAFENVEHVLAGHEEKAEFFARERRERFPNAAPWKLHACCHPHREKQYRSMFPSVTDWHPHEMGVGATSASKAAKLAYQRLGFDEVILCGCPMDQPGYFPGEAKVPQHIMCARIGDFGKMLDIRGKAVVGGNGATTPVQETRIIKGYRANLALLAQGEFKGKVFSMSGFTRAQLGLPPELIE
jgi:hypothetical protein